jgi:threonine/homoserine/homoserine lactone efflux protein
MNAMRTFLLAFSLSIGAVVSPGPVTAAIINEAPMRGWSVGPWIAAGHTSLEFVMVALISLGLSTDLVSPVVEAGIAIGGGIVLMGMGLSYLIGLRKNTFRLSATATNLTAKTPSAMIGLGILATISNPFWFTWWLTVAAGFLTQLGSLDIIGVSAFYVGHISADFAWDTTLSLGAHLGSRWMNDRLYRLLIFVTACFMMYLGIAFIVNGIR